MILPATTIHVLSGGEIREHTIDQRVIMDMGPLDLLEDRGYFRKLVSIRLIDRDQLVVGNEGLGVHNGQRALTGQFIKIILGQLEMEQ